MCARHILLTGPPGIGKTTLIHKTCEALQSAGLTVQGFYTEEIRAGGRRTGFDVVTLSGSRGPLARVSTDSLPGSSRREYKVGQYSVKLQSFEQTALPSIQMKSDVSNHVIVIDEVGKMELFSQTFTRTVRSLLDKTKTTVLATIPIAKGKPIAFVEELRNRQDATVFKISLNNRDTILKDIVEAVKTSVQIYQNS